MPQEDVSFRLTAQNQTKGAFGEVEASLGGLGKAISNARGLIVSLGAAAGVQQFASMILEANAATAKFKDLGEIAGTTAERISVFEVPARLASTSIESVAASVAKLGKSLGEARLGDVGKASLLKALGIDVNDGRDAALVMVDVAKALSGMKDQAIAGKVSNDLLGKSFAEMRPFMKEVAEQGVLVARVTNEQAAAADRFQKDLTRLSLAAEQAKRSFANELLPSLTHIAEAMVRAQKEGGALAAVIAGIQTAITGTDQYKNDKALVELTERKLVLENQLMRMRQYEKQGGLLLPDAIQRAQIELDKINAQLKTTLAYRQELAKPEGGPPVGAGGAAGTGGAVGGGAAEDRIRERMAFEKHYAERVAAQQGFATRYGEAIKFTNIMAQEAQKAGLLSDVELIHQLAANEDARLQVLILSLQKQQALHQQKGDLEAARKAQEAIAIAEAQRVANDAIAAARASSVVAVSEEKWLQDLAQKVTRIQMENMTERELLEHHLIEKQQALDFALQNNLISAAAYTQNRETLELQHQAALGDIHAQGVLARRKFEQMNMVQQAQTIFGEMANITAGVAQHNKTLFGINKIAGIANAVINAYTGISKTMAAYPYPYNIALAALHAAAAFAQVSAIQATSFGGGVTAPSIAGSTAAMPVTPVSSGAPAQRGPDTIVNIRGDDIFSGRTMAKLADRFNEFSRDGGRVVVVQS